MTEFKNEIEEICFHLKAGNIIGAQRRFDRFIEKCGLPKEVPFWFKEKVINIENSEIIELN